MKRIEALIRPHKLLEVKDALVAMGVDEFTVAGVRGFGGRHRQTACYRGIVYAVEFVSRTRLEVFVADALGAEVVAAILKAAGTGESGDGAIFVQHFADPICIGGADASCVDAAADDDLDDSSPPDDGIHKEMSAAAFALNLSKLLGPVCAGWRYLFT